ncbi:MAG: hypothetical protein OQL08_05835 [Gammaproteobacteria bacterium]|nr:hypothetical protein [Gammaproteobacteria bacterium]
MNKLIIPLLISAALLGGCQHATVRHSVYLPIVVSEHRHLHGEVVIVHQHEGGPRARHSHKDYDERHRVAAPRPVIRHQRVTVIEPPSHKRHEGRAGRALRSDNFNDRKRPQGRPHALPQREPGQAQVVAPQGASRTPHALRQPPATQVTPAPKPEQTSKSVRPASSRRDEARIDPASDSEKRGDDVKRGAAKREAEEKRARKYN